MKVDKLTLATISAVTILAVSDLSSQQAEEREAFPYLTEEPSMDQIEYPGTQSQVTEPEWPKPNPNCQYPPIRQPGESPESFESRLKLYLEACEPNDEAGDSD